MLAVFHTLWLVCSALARPPSVQDLRTRCPDGPGACLLIVVDRSRLVTIRIEVVIVVTVEGKVEVVKAFVEMVIASFEMVAMVLLEGQSPSRGTHRARAGRMVACSELGRDGIGVDVADSSEPVILEINGSLLGASGTPEAVWVLIVLLLDHCEDDAT